MEHQHPWNRKTTADYWDQVREQQKFLKEVLPSAYCETLEIAVSGSAALAWAQERWEVGPMWVEPGDIDVFVAGRPGENEDQFIDIVNGVVERTGHMGREISLWKMYDNLYAVENVVIKVVDIAVAGMDCIFSFIQCPGVRDVEEVVESFDIDICRVIYCIHDDTFRAEAAVIRHIEEGNAFVRLMVVPILTGIPAFSIKKARRTRNRMRKYIDRGFTFPEGYPLVPARIISPTFADKGEEK